MLIADFLESEVIIALKQMALLKAPGLDGMPQLFYQQFWQVMNHDVTNFVLSWLNSSTLPHPLNHTFITLIPKIKNPEYVHDFRPISLCNILYKVFSKVLAYRLKTLLPSMITEHQFAFTKDSLITDNIMIAFETLHCMKSHNSGPSRFMALKLDMSKAYDRVEWNFLENIMQKMGFNEQWIGLVMVCVRSVIYSILVNGEPKEMIQPSRGIRQRDPFSLFLFILLCTEGLHGLISNAANSRNIEGFSLCRRGSKLTRHHQTSLHSPCGLYGMNVIKCDSINPTTLSTSSLDWQRIAYKNFSQFNHH